MAIVFRRMFSSRTSCVVVLVLIWSGFAWCGEIHDAVKNSDIAKVEKLIKHNPALVFSKDEDGFTPLHLAAANGSREIVEFLLTTKADVNSSDNAGSTPMHQAAAAAGQDDSIIELLLKHGANINAMDDQGLRPLHYAVLADNRDAVIALLNHGADVNAKDYEAGDTPLILAAENGYKDIVEVLLAHGASVNLGNVKGTPFTCAIRAGHSDTAGLIRKYGGHE